MSDVCDVSQEPAVGLISADKNFPNPVLPAGLCLSGWVDTEKQENRPLGDVTVVGNSIYFHPLCSVGSLTSHVVTTLCWLSLH